jgi:hypothetical protein
MSHDFPMQVWAAWFRDHIHTDVHGQLAIFAKRKDAQAWIDEHGLGLCSLRAFRLGKLSKERLRSIRASERGNVNVNK